MIRDITIGQYYPADSPLHRMDARVKIIITLLYIISLFVIKSFIGYAFVILCLAAVIKISKVPFRFMVKGLKALIFIIVFTAVINLFTTKGDTVLFAKIGVPAHDIAMMMTIALRFIPTLLDETDKIIKAQQARGADFDTGSIVSKAKALVPILVPLFISAFRRADELAMAMEARCYNGSGERTRMNVMKITSTDYISSLLFICYFAVLIGIRFIIG